MRVRFAMESDIPMWGGMTQDAFVSLAHSRTTLWHRMLKDGHAIGVVFEEGAQVVAFMMSLFISSVLRETILEARAPIALSLFPAYNQNGILHRSKRSQRDEVLQAHFGKGLHLVALCGVCHDYRECRELRWLMYQSLLRVHRGYYLTSFLREVYGELDYQCYERLGLQCYKTPSFYSPQWRPHQPYLLGAERNGTVVENRIADLFGASAPSIKLSLTQRQIAQLALLCRLSNAEIAECLGLREATVQWHWANLCRLYSDFFANSKREEENLRRGRGTVMRYFAEHPEAIYPLEIPRLFYTNPASCSEMSNCSFLGYPFPYEMSRVSSGAADCR